MRVKSLVRRPNCGREAGRGVPRTGLGAGRSGSRDTRHVAVRGRGGSEVQNDPLKGAGWVFFFDKLSHKRGILRFEAGSWAAPPLGEKKARLGEACRRRGMRGAN